MSFNSDVTLTIEVGWDASGPLDTTFTWSDVTSYCRSFTTKTGRGHEFDTVQAGVATFVFDNSDRRFEPEYTSGAYYPNVLPMKPIRITATYNSTTYDVWYGFIESLPQEWPQAKDAVCRVTAVDGFKVLAFWEVTDTESQELSGTRIGNLLDSASWPAGWRDIDTGQYQVQAYTPNCAAVLGEIDRVVRTEDGLFFMAPNGDATFHDAAHRGGASVATFTKVGDGGLKFAHGTYGYDDLNIWNDVTVAAVDVSPQAADDATSVAAYGRRKLKRFDTLHISAANALTVAQAIRDRYKNPGYRLPALVVNPLADAANLWPQVLGRGLSDKITVSVTPPAGGTAISTDVYIEGIDHQVDAQTKSWITTFVLSPA